MDLFRSILVDVVYCILYIVTEGRSKSNTKREPIAIT